MPHEPEQTPLARLEEVLSRFEEPFVSFQAHDPGQKGSSAPELSRLKEALVYPLQAGGKRVRPRLCLLFAQALGSSSALDNATLAARAVELIHTYSLVHDDLPCMDDDDLRRGKPTVHKVYGEAQAVLVGDALLTDAFFTLSQLRPNRMPNITALCVEVLAELSGHRGMIGGQWLDMALEEKSKNVATSGSSREPVSLETLQTIHTLKTGALLGASIELGVICGLGELEISTQSVAELRELARQSGLALGLAFQLIDDVLDATQSSSELGKTAGKDTAAGKQTAVSVMGITEASDMAASLTAEAKSLVARLFERLPAGDSHCEAARESVNALLNELLNRKN